MTNTKVLLICIPLLTVIACKGKSKKHNDGAPVPPVVTATANVTGTPGTPVTPVVTPPVTPNPNQSTADVNQSTADVNQSSGKSDAAPECETILLDFDKKPDGSAFRKGEKIKDQYKDYGVEFLSHKRLANGDWENNVPPILFDTAERPNVSESDKYKEIDCQYGNCDGFDWDLTTESEGNALIIAENMFDIVPNDDKDFVTYPDDNTSGGVIKLFFSKPTSLVSIDFIDIEDESNLELYSRDANGNYTKTTTQVIPSAANGALQTLSIDDHSYTDKLMINLTTSGAVDNIKICVKK